MFKMKKTISDLIIGKNSYTSAAYFNGTIDEIRISNIARS